MRKQQAALAVTLALTAASVGSAVQAQDAPMSEGMVSAVLKAPIVADGDVAGALTDLVIVYDTSLDPSVEGRTLPAGKSIRVTFPDAFTSTEVNVGPAATCESPCNTGVLLQGWPQRPLPPTPEFYAVEMDGSHTIVFTAVQDLAPGATPGIKQNHLILAGITNPTDPGTYEIVVEAETGPDGALETGTGVVTIHPSTQPSINPTSIFANNAEGEPFGNTIYQDAAPGESPQWNWDFFLFGADDGPIVGAELTADGDIVLDGAAIGSYTIEAPDGASGHGVSGGPSVDAVAPVLGKPAGRLTAVFTAGDTPGEYVTTFQMDGGNSLQMFVNVAG